MNLALKILARIALVLTIAPPFLFLTDNMNLENVKIAMITGAILWFVTAPRIQNQNKERITHAETRDNI